MEHSKLVNVMATRTNPTDRAEVLALLEPDLADQFLRAVNVNPNGVHYTLDALASDPIAMEPVTEYITDVDERCSLFRELEQLLQEPDHLPLRLNATMLGFVMVAPIPKIKESISVIRSAPISSANTPQCRLIGVNTVALFAVRSYLPKGGRQADPPATPPMAVPISILGAPHSARNVIRHGGEAAKIRDGHVCVFVGTSDPAAAHIFPFATSAKRDFNHLNQLLQMFWGSDKTMAWRRHYENAGITQSAQNYISMNHQLHYWFDNARFALRPLRQTRNEIVVQFHWLRKTPLKPRTDIMGEQDILGQAGLTDHQSWGVNLAHRRSGFPIQTGQTFIIRAENPEDLPSFELLDLQWNLLRVAAISGAAEATDEDYETDDDEAEAALDLWSQTMYGRRSL
ncbi:hypothetical protein ACRALDRAFT_2026691 [Sodiomyces alcalophilus JCM 7366]|uniref:uncharacterized protein n=1 Tax=Sodiomyces alcalophilus JCM 7366 TaxID=591952 RepID=UPI0039B6068A